LKVPPSKKYPFWPVEINASRVIDAPASLAYQLKQQTLLTSVDISQMGANDNKPIETN
jgi:hypothetical protein